MNNMNNMDTKQLATYSFPEIRVVDLMSECFICISGNHEGITEENWDEP